jgi:hypothetical protein
MVNTQKQLAQPRTPRTCVRNVHLGSPQLTNQLHSITSGPAGTPAAGSSRIPALGTHTFHPPGSIHSLCVLQRVAANDIVSRMAYIRTTKVWLLHPVCAQTMDSWTWRTASSTPQMGYTPPLIETVPMPSYCPSADRASAPPSSCSGHGSARRYPSVRIEARAQRHSSAVVSAPVATHWCPPSVSPHRRRPCGLCHSHQRPAQCTAVLASESDPLQHSDLPTSAAQHSDLPASAAQHSDLPTSAAQHSDLPTSAAQHSELPASAAQHADLPTSAAQH